MSSIFYAGMIPFYLDTCISWSDDFERAPLGPDWMPFEYPDESLSDPNKGFVTPVIVDGKLLNPLTSGNGSEPGTLKRASVVRTVATGGDSQAIEASIYHAFQTGGVSGTNFRARVELMLIADPDTGTHMMITFGTESGAGVGSDERYIGVHTRFYYGPGESDFEIGDGMTSGPHTIGAVGDSNVYFLNAIINNNGRYTVTLNGVTYADATWPVAIPWGGRQGLSVRWETGTAVPGAFVSPSIGEADGGCSEVVLSLCPSYWLGDVTNHSETGLLSGATWNQTDSTDPATTYEPAYTNSELEVCPPDSLVACTPTTVMICVAGWPAGALDALEANTWALHDAVGGHLGIPIVQAMQWNARIGSLSIEVSATFLISQTGVSPHTDDTAWLIAWQVDENFVTVDSGSSSSTAFPIATGPYFLDIGDFYVTPGASSLGCFTSTWSVPEGLEAHDLGSVFPTFGVFNGDWAEATMTSLGGC